MKKNFKGESSALHGDGWQNSWVVKNLEKNFVIMKLIVKNKNWPFKYSGYQIIKINNNELKISLEIKNLDIESMPCGLGFHPWFDMTPNTSLQMNAKKFWIVGKDNLFKKISNLNLIISSSDTARIQEAHIFLGHYIFEQVENLLFNKNQKKTLLMLFSFMLIATFWKWQVWVLFFL